MTLSIKAIPLRRACGLAIALSWVAMGPALAAAQSPQQPAATHRISKAQVDLAITSVSPKSVGPSSKVELTGYIANKSGQPLQGLAVRLRSSSAQITSRGQLANYANNQGPALRIRTEAKPVQASGRESRQTWTLSTTAKALGLTRFGAYPIAVEVLSGEESLAVQTTFLTYVPKTKNFQPTRIAWVWPLIDQPRRTNDATFLNDGLETDMRPEGRLGGLVEAAKVPVKGKRIPLTWAIDPALLDDVNVMAAADGYLVRASRTAKASQRPSSALAKSWLGQVKTLTATDPFFVTPYADPDSVALARTAKGRAQLRSAYQNASVAQGLLGRAPTDAIGWPVSGVADQNTLNRMAKAGTKSLLMNSSVLLAPNQVATPGARTTLQTSENAATPTFAYDDVLSDIVSADTRSLSGATLAEQRFLAETATITNELPDRSRTLVIAPGRRWSPGPTFAKNVLKYTGSASWLRPASLQQVANAKPQPRTFIGYQNSFEARELGGAYLKAVQQISADATSFAGILAEPVDPAYRYERAVLRLQSSAWRSHRTQAHNTRLLVARDLASDIGKVKIVTGKPYTMAGKSGRVQFTVANHLTDQSIKIKLKVFSERPSQLSIGTVTHPQGLVITAGHLDGFDVPMRASGNFTVRVGLQLTTAGTPPKNLGKVQYVTVRATGLGQTALLITAGAIAVVFIGVGTRAVRARRRRSRAEETGDGTAGDQSALGGAPAEPPVR